MKVGGCDEARGWRKFEIWSVCDAFSSILAKKLLATLRALLSKPFLPSHYKDILKNVQNVWRILLQIYQRQCLWL